MSTYSPLDPSIVFFHANTPQNKERNISDSESNELYII